MYHDISDILHNVPGSPYGGGRLNTGMPCGPGHLFLEPHSFRSHVRARDSYDDRE